MIRGWRAVSFAGAGLVITGAFFLAGGLTSSIAGVETLSTNIEPLALGDYRVEPAAPLPPLSELLVAEASRDLAAGPQAGSPHPSPSPGSAGPTATASGGPPNGGGPGPSQTPSARPSPTPTLSVPMLPLPTATPSVSLPALPLPTATPTVPATTLPLPTPPPLP